MNREDEKELSSSSPPSSDTDGGAELVRVSTNDITARQAAEAALRIAEQRAIVEYERLLNHLASLARTFGNARDLSVVFRAVREFAAHSAPCNSVLISLYNQERHERTAVYAWSDVEELDLPELPPLPMTDSPHSRAILTGKVIITDEYQASVEGQPILNVGFQRTALPPLSSLVAPMNFMGRTLGTIEVQSHNLAAFSQEHATAFTMAANLAAIAIENVRLLEREMERADREAESEKMRSLGQLAAGVAHDFNNSLMAILGRTQLLLRIITDEKQRRSLSVIETAALDAGETVRRIQTFARRAPRSQVSSVSVAKLINDAIQLTRTRWKDEARAEGRHYDMNFTSAIKEGSDNVAANPAEVRQVLVNIIINSLDAMPSGGSIEILVSTGDEFIVIEIADTGEGIPPALLDRVFEPFFTTKGPQGSGLGLAVSYGVIQRHGGTIEVASKLGQGTILTLRLPQAIAAPAVTPMPPRRRAHLPTHRILVVDDEDAVREVLVELLKDLRQEVVDVPSAAAALDALANATFDLMITDLSMPDTDGLTLAAEARHRAPDMLIALATGYDQTIPAGTPDPALIDTVFNKPFQLSLIHISEPTRPY